MVYLLLVVIFILNSIFSFWIYRLLLRSKLKQAEIELKTELSEGYKEATQNMYDYVMNFKHDYLNIYSTMSIYIERSDSSELKRFFHENIAPLTEELKEVDGSLRSLLLIEDIPLQSILYSFLIKAQGKRVDSEISVSEEIPNIKVNILSLCRALGIFLDNALEACERMEDPYVDVIIVRTDEYIKIVIENPYAGEAVPVVNLLQKQYTTKGEGHGRGLANVKNIFDELENASLKIENGDNVFVVTITITQ